MIPVTPTGQCCSPRGTGRGNQCGSKGESKNHPAACSAPGARLFDRLTRRCVTCNGAQWRRPTRGRCPGLWRVGARNRYLERMAGPANALAARPDDRRRAGGSVLVPVGTLPACRPTQAVDHCGLDRHRDIAVTSLIRAAVVPFLPARRCVTWLCRGCHRARQVREPHLLKWGGQDGNPRNRR